MYPNSQDYAWGWVKTVCTKKCKRSPWAYPHCALRKTSPRGPWTDGLGRDQWPAAIWEGGRFEFFWIGPKVPHSVPAASESNPPSNWSRKRRARITSYQGEGETGSAPPRPGQVRGAAAPQQLVVAEAEDGAAATAQKQRAAAALGRLPRARGRGESRLGYCRC